jgi:hypothetical protein
MQMTAKLDKWTVAGLAGKSSTTGSSAEILPHQLRLHTAVSTGCIESYIVGGFGGGQWLHTLTGPPISQVTDCIDQAQPGQVVISRECVAVLKKGEEERLLVDADGGIDAQSLALQTSRSTSASPSLLNILNSELDEGAHSLVEAGKFDKIQCFARGKAGTPGLKTSSKSWTAAETTRYTKFSDNIRGYMESWEVGNMPPPQRKLNSALQSFAPAPVLRAIRSGSASSGELRRLTIMFLHLDPPQVDSGHLEKIQHVCGIIQREVGHYPKTAPTQSLAYKHQLATGILMQKFHLHKYNYLHRDLYLFAHDSVFLHTSILTRCCQQHCLRDDSSR